jgi:hypothetical protein
MESAMRGWLAMGILGVALLMLPASAFGASIGLVPRKSCYRSGEQVFLGGTGFTANTPAEVTLDRKSLGRTTADGQGMIRGLLSLGAVRGERKRLLAVTDQANAANYGALTLRATDVAVSVKPRRAGPGRAVRFKARGFTNSKRLYAHIRRGRRYRRNVGIGRLNGACRKLSRKKRIFSLGTRPGVYTVQFDGKRRYSKKTRPRILYRVTIFQRLVHRGSVSAAAESWVRLP